MIIHWLSERSFRGEAARFALIGIKTNVIYYLCYVVLVFAGVPPRFALTTIYTFGILYTFGFNRTYVFKTDAPPLSQLLRYALTYLVAWALNIILLEGSVSILGVNPYVAQAFLIPIIAAINFLALKFFVFYHQAT
jgi:putative flippase GtrA